MSGTKYVDSEVGPQGHGAGMLPRRRLPAAARTPGSLTHRRSGARGGSAAGGRTAGHLWAGAAGQGKPGRSSPAGRGEGSCWVSCGKSGVWRALQRDHWDGEGTVMALNEGRYRERGKYSEDRAVQAPCPGQHSMGGRARAAWRGQYGEGAVRRAPDAPCRARGATPAPTPPRGHSLRPGATRRGRGRLAAGAGAGAWHGGGVVCAPRPRLNSRARPPRSPEPAARGTRGRLPSPPSCAERTGPALPSPPFPASLGSPLPPALSLVPAGFSVHCARPGAGQHLQAQQQDDGR